MYPLSSAALTALRAGAKQSIDITCTPTTGTAFDITEADIIGAPTISRASVSGDKIEIGSAIVSELSLTLDNQDGRYNSKTFEGAELYVVVKFPLASGSTYSMPMGYFTVDETPRKLTAIKLTARDRMARFDRPYDTELTYPASIYAIVQDACTNCGVTNAVPSNSLNCTYSVPERPEADNLTYRQVIMWAAELMGLCLFVNYDGQLTAKWYTANTSKHEYLEPSDRFISGNTDYAENSITITGVRIVGNDEAKTEYLAGTTDYAFNIEGNLLAQESMPLSTIATKILSSRAITYLPMSCQTHSFPHLYPLDILKFRTASGDSYQTILTNVTYTFRQNSKLEGKGQTATQAGYASLGAFTSRQQTILERTRAQTYAAIKDAQQAVLALNETIANSMGLYVTTVDDGAGGTITYYHDHAALADSNTIYCRNAGGYAWTNDGWNDGNPTWNYGIDKNGDAVLRSIAANKLVADYIIAGQLVSPTGKFSFNLDTGHISASDIDITGGNIDMDGGTFRTHSEGFGVDLSPGYINLYQGIGSSFDEGIKYMQIGSSALIYGGITSDWYATFAAPATDGNFVYKGFRFGSSPDNVFWGLDDLGAKFWDTDYMLVEADALRVRKQIIVNEYGYATGTDPSGTARYMGLAIPGTLGGMTRRASFGVSMVPGTSSPGATILLEQLSDGEYSVNAELGMLSAEVGTSVTIRTRTGSTNLPALTFKSAAMYYDGKTITTSSTERIKKDIEAVNFSASDKIRDSQIYSYHLKDEHTHDGQPDSITRYGLVVERECPEEVIDVGGDSINLYSMCSLGWKAIQEIISRLDRLEATI